MSHDGELEAQMLDLIGELEELDATIEKLELENAVLKAALERLEKLHKEVRHFRISI